MRALTALSRFVSASFPFWVLLFAILAFFQPAWFLPLTVAIAPLLGLVMFGMGLTLKAEDFREVARHPIRVLIGVLAQFVIMPGLAWLLCRLLQLPAEIAVGVILVGCCPGGTASNVMTWLSRGDVALSVAITSVTTLLAPLVTPALVWLLASAWLPVSFAAMFLSILQVVLVPIALGLLAQRLLGDPLLAPGSGAQRAVQRLAQSLRFAAGRPVPAHGRYAALSWIPVGKPCPDR